MEMNNLKNVYALSFSYYVKKSNSKMPLVFSSITSTNKDIPKQRQSKESSTSSSNKNNSKGFLNPLKFFG